MKKSELLSWLKDEYEQWEALLGEIGPERMDQPGVIGDWSMKDVVAHLNGWQRRHNAHLAASLNGDPEPSSPWPAELQTEDEINGWIIQSSRQQVAHDVVDESYQLLRQLLAIMEGLPEDARIEQVQHEGRIYNLVWVGDRRFQAGEFFDHFHDDHETDVRAWGKRVENR